MREREGECAVASQQDPELEASQALEKVSIDEILEAQRVVQEREQAEKKKREQLLRSRGLHSLPEDDS